MTDKLLLGESMMSSAVGVLGSMLIDEEAVGPMLMAVSESDFHVPEQRKVYRAIKDLYSEGGGVDAILVNERLGGKYTEYLANLINATPTAANADAYARELKRTSRLWQLKEIGEAIGTAESEDDVQSLIDMANMLFCERSDVRRVTMEQAFREFFTRKAGQEEDFLRWGIPDLDEQLHVGKGDMVVIGGYPSAGKTAFSLQVAFHIAKKKRVGFFSYETGADKLYDRAVACQTHTSFGKIMKNKLGVEDYARIRESKSVLTAPAMELLETSGMTVSGIGAYAMAHHYDVIFIDYLQKIPGTKATDEFQRVSQVSNDLQQLGRRTGKIIIALSQLSRPDKKDGKPAAPTLSSLRQSGQIEQDADAVLLLYKEDPTSYQSKRVLDLAKNKDGIAGLGMLLDFDGDTQRFKKAAQIYRPHKQKSEQNAQQSIFRPISSNEPSPFDKI